MFLIKDLFNKDSRGITPCYCSRHSSAIPRIVCNAEFSKEVKNTAISNFDKASACMENDQYEKALAMTAESIRAMETESKAGGLLLFDVNLKRKVHALRGRAQLRLGNYEDALHCLRVAIGRDPLGRRLIYGSEASKLRCDACVDGIRALASLGDINAANGWYSYLMDMKVEGSLSDGGLTDQYLAKVQSETKAIISNDATLTLTSAILVDSEPAREGISCCVRQSSWKSVGKLSTEDGTICPTTYAVLRLHLAIVWVRGQLLIWNYKQSKVVQWIQTTSHECSQLIHTSGSSSIFVLHDSSGSPFIIVLNQAHRMKQGGICSIENAMYTTLGVATFGNQTQHDWLLHIFALRKKYGRVTEMAAAQVTSTKSWNMAMVRNSANLEILVFAGSQTIAPDTVLGPMALLKDEASFVLGGGGNSHLNYIYELRFVDNGNANILVSSSGDKSIKIWDLHLKSCKHTIRGFSSIVRELICTSSLLFGAAMKDHSYSSGRQTAEESTFGSHCINVWNIDSGRHMATLRSKYSKTVNSLIALPQHNILLSGHSTGDVNVWNYDKFGHVHGIRALSGSFALGLSFHLHDDYIAIMSMTHIVMLTDPNQIEGGNDSEPSLPIIGQALNCGNCGLWKIDNSSQCSLCREVRFCDEACLREAWPKHKKSCHKRK